MNLCNEWETISWNAAGLVLMSSMARQVWTSFLKSSLLTSSHGRHENLLLKYRLNLLLHEAVLILNALLVADAGDLPLSSATSLRKRATSPVSLSNFLNANYPDFCGILPISRRQKYKSRYPDRDCQNTPKSRFSKNPTRFTTISPDFHLKFQIPRCLSTLTNQKAGLWPPLLFTCIACVYIGMCELV